MNSLISKKTVILRLLCIPILLFTICSLVGCAEEAPTLKPPEEKPTEEPPVELPPLPKTPEDIKLEIDNLFLAEVGTTYYGNWMFTKSEVREMEQLRITLGLTPEERQELAQMGITLEISEDEWIDLWAGIIREGSNWVDLYQTDIFDCSEMSAFAECLLEQMGFKTNIVVSDELGHAWVIIEKSDGSFIPIEATGMFTVTPETIADDMTYDDYLFEGEAFETIYDAEYLASGDFDWWNSVDAFEQWKLNDIECARFTEEWVNRLVEEWLYY